MAYTKLANSILTSTIWMESDQTRIVWLTLLAMADKNGEVQASIPGLANVARVSVQACEEAIRIFMSPDPYSRTKVEDGRRLEEIDGGWLIINHEKYRDLCSDTDRKKKAALRQQRRRARLKGGGEASRNVTLVTHAGVTDCDKSHQNSQADTDTDTDTDTNTKKKRTPPKGSWKIPERLDTDEVRTLLGEFARMRSDIRKPIKNLDRASSVLEHFDDTRHLVYALQTCIANEYQGLKPDYRPPVSKPELAADDFRPQSKPTRTQGYQPPAKAGAE